MIDPIDFSGKDDEYLSSDLKQKVLAFSIIWAVVGFIFSAFFFLGRKNGPASQILDRRQAEAKVVGSSPSSTGASWDGFSSRVPQVRAYLEPPPRERGNWKNLAQLGSEPAPSSAEPEQEETEKVEATTLDTTVDNGSDIPLSERRRTRRSAARKDPPKLQASDEDPSRLLYPVNPSRPEPSNLTTVARRAERSVIRLSNTEGEFHVGMVIDGKGRAIISDTILGDGSLDRVWVQGRMARASLLARDAEYGIALIEIDGGAELEPVPLAPDPPARGKELVAFGPSPSRSLSTVVKSGSSFGTAGFLLEGYLGSATWGTPLLNERGELVGCHFGSLPNFPGAGIHLAADSAAIYRLLRGYDSSNGSANQAVQEEAAKRLASLAFENRDEAGTKKGRVLPDQGISQLFLGMSTDEAAGCVSSPSRDSGPFGMENWRSEAPPVELVFANGYLCAISTEYTGFSTPTGLSMGAPVDTSLLSRTFDSYLYVDGVLAIVPGLDIMLASDGKVRQFVVKPEL